MFGSSEILIVALVVLVLFGATALPKFFRSLGKAKSEFQKGASEADGGDSASTAGNKSATEDSNRDANGDGAQRSDATSTTEKHRSSENQ